jgi:serine/threonine protein kinase
VALKVLKHGTTGAGVIEFETEGRLLSGLTRCSNVVNLLGPAMEKDAIQVRPVAAANVLVELPVSYIVLELADACLADLLADRHLLAWEERLLLLRHVVKGVHQMHLQGIVHRDLKSENALVFAVPREGFTAKVADLGRSRDLNQPVRFVAQDYLIGRGDWRFAPPEFLWWLGADDPTSFSPGRPVSPWLRIVRAGNKAGRD